MGIEQLKTRIALFQKDYFDTPEGRAHVQRQTEESKRVQATFHALKQGKDAGEDITDKVLLTLLPHSDTKGNRERGAWISTWSCVTKDVKSWFEGAKWKKASDWPAVADWLLEIAEAGRREEWDKWKAMATAPIQKGFACGFITPILYCLNNKLPVINSKVVTTFEAVAAELGVDAKISSSLQDYRESRIRLHELVEKLKPLGIVGYMEWDIYCHWNVAKRLGGKLKDGPKPPDPTPPEVLSASKLIQELREAQHDTKNPDRFEAAVAGAFKALGFETQHIGGSGEADVVAEAMLGEDSFSLVIDAKTCQKGTTRSNINYDPIKSHQEEHEADYAIVVAPAYSQGDTVNHAAKGGVGLLTTESLIELVSESENHGLSLCLLEKVLEQKGLMVVQLEATRKARSDLVTTTKAVLHMFETHQRGEESSTGLSEEQVTWLLKGGGIKFSPEHVGAVIRLLSSRLIGVLENRENAYVLTMPASAASRRIVSIGIEVASSE